MLKPIVAFLLLTAPTVAATQTTAPGQWKLAASDEGCVVHTSSGKGTVVSIAANPAQGALLFVVQNKQLASLEDGEAYPVQVEFDDMGEWEVQAVAQKELDADGPGVMFAVQPSREDGSRFIKEFAAAQGMHIGREGAVMDTLPLSGSKPAMAQMAQCLGKMWSNASAPEAEPVFEGGGKPIKI
ncbi:MAG TPA: hypothetical protein VNT25_03610 [Allosphingosinicella sp.]|nr:hypothetical protein [Allosphingosinicella sp.]